MTDATGRSRMYAAALTTLCLLGTGLYALPAHGQTTAPRFIQLCHGSVAGPSCDTTNAVNAPSDEHQLTARVTDREGAPVANVPVQFRETGPAIFTPQGGSTATVNSDANGLARASLVSDVEGQSTVVAEIDPGSRGSGTTDDECEQPAGTGGEPAAGNCISQTLTKTWDDSPDPACDDGLDNDGDGYVDADDPGCTGPTDDSEDPVDPPPPTVIRHERRIGVRFTHGSGADENDLVIFGRLRLVESSFTDCIARQPVKIQRRVDGQWVTIKTTTRSSVAEQRSLLVHEPTTNRRGRYAIEIFDQASRYRALAIRTEIPNEDRNRVDVCLKAVRAKRHTHR